MAKPRIFISSTFYDLKYIRNDLEKFTKELGYDPVMNELGQIPYGKSDALEQYCYREISTCDVLVNIIGGKFGSQSATTPYSISQMELKTAHELHKQIYVFVEKQVHVEYRTYLNNQNSKEFKPEFVDDLRIYKFLKEIYTYPSNNVIADFENVSDILEYLREQWSGLFQRFLQEESKREDYKISQNLKDTANTLSKIIEYTTRERDETIKSILIHSHPVFTQIAQATGIPIRIFFSDFEEMNILLKTFRFEEDIFTPNDGFYIYERTLSGIKTTLKISTDIFDESNKLKAVEQGEWDRKFVKYKEEHISVPDDDIPF